MSVTTAEVQLEQLAGEGPEWLASLRRDAFARYRELPFPEARDELWRYTDLGLLKLEQYEPVTGVAPAVPPKALEALELSGRTSAGQAVHADGGLVSLTLSDEARSKGVVWTDLPTAVAEHADTLRPLLGSLVGTDDVFTAWSLAMHRGGTFLYVPDGIHIEDPFQALHWMSAEGASIWPRTVVVVGRGSSIVFNDLYTSDALGSPSLAGPVTELFAHDEAKVGWVTWQDWGRGVRHLAHVKAHLGRSAVLNTLLVTLGGDFSRTWKECVLAGEGAESVMLGLSFAHEDQRFEHWTLQDHAVGKTRSDLLYKGALADSSQTLYYGTIHIRPGAQYSDAYQANRNLTLSPKAKALTNPQLRIENSLVRCTHGATVGRVDEEHLFYLMSRGISRPDAERLVVYGFFNEVLGRVEWSGMHERLGEAIHSKLERE